MRSADIQIAPHPSTLRTPGHPCAFCGANRKDPSGPTCSTLCAEKLAARQAVATWPLMLIPEGEQNRVMDLSWWADDAWLEAELAAVARKRRELGVAVCEGDPR